MKEPPCFDGISLDPTIYLRWVQMLQDYFEAKEYFDEECFLITTQKLQGYAYYWFKWFKRERALQCKPKIKTGTKLKSHMNVRFNPY